MIFRYTGIYLMLICTICIPTEYILKPEMINNWIMINIIYIITLRIQALSLIESHDLLEDKHTEFELRHN